MLRGLFRLVGLFSLAGAFAAAIIDAAQSVATERLVMTPLGTSLYSIFPNQFSKIQPIVETHIHPLAWDPLLVHVLLTPSFVVLALIGLLMFALARRRAQPIGHSNRQR
jgi:hypothetical protein